ncbi:MAG: histidine kinase, partial [Bradymonadaceae bacterium]
MDPLQEFFSTQYFMPHGHCYQWTPAIVWLQVLTNLTIGVAYVMIALTLAYIIRRVDDIPFKMMYVAFGVFIISCGFTHFFDIYVIW